MAIDPTRRTGVPPVIVARVHEGTSEHAPAPAGVPFAPEALVPAEDVPPLLGRTVTRAPLYGEGKYFVLDGLYANGTLVGLDWHKASKPGAPASSLDARTAIVAALTSVGGEISSVFGQGSPRIANLLRGRPYVQISPPGGRVDHVIESPDGRTLGPLETGVRIGASEVEEETGGRVVEGLLAPLHAGWVPTNPHLSSEADRPVGAIVALPTGAKSIGDGGNMEIAGSAAATYSLVKDAFRLARAGRINEAARWEVYMRDLLEGLGYSVELGTFAGSKRSGPLDAVAARRELARIDQPSAGEPREQVEYSPVVKHVRDAHRVDDKHVVFDLIVDHARKTAGGGLEELGRAHPNIFLHTDYDLVKYVEVYVDPVAGPLVKLRDVERPACADVEHAKDGARAPVLRDTQELEVPLPFQGTDLESLMAQAAKLDFSALARARLEASVSGDVIQLGAPDLASAGQSDLQYHFFAVQIDKPRSRDGFMPLAAAVDALKDGDAPARALLYRLADHLGWMCSANTSVAHAAARLGIPQGELPRLI